MSGSKMNSGKGQYFLMASIFMLIAFISVSNFVSDSGDGKKISKSIVFGNIKDDFPKTLNTILEDDYSSGNIDEKMKQYAGFLQEYSMEHNLELEIHYAIGIPEGNDIKVVSGNFEKKSLENNYIEIDGTRQAFDLGSDETKVLDFSSVPSAFNVEYSFPDAGSSGNFTGYNRLFSIFSFRLQRGIEVWQDVLIF